MVHYDAAYRESATLRDGTQVTLRLMRPDDVDLLLEGFTHLSAESRYRRFLSAKESLSPEEIRYFMAVDGDRHLAILAVVIDPHGQERSLGGARFIRVAGAPDTADVAVTVIDEAQHKGLGSLLVMRLMGAAKERGIRRLHFDMLASNAPMVSLLRDIAPDIQPVVQAGMATVEIDLDDTAPSEPSARP